MTEKDEIKTAAKGAARGEKKPRAASSAYKDFRIGEYSFDSFHEYREGKEDLQKISVIQEKLDIQDPETAVRLYRDMRDGKLTFKTAIGRDFASHISDIVAERSKGLLADREIIDEADRKTGVTRWIGIGLTCAAIFLFIYFGGQQLMNYRAAKKAEELRAAKATSEKTDDSTETTTESGEGTKLTLPETDPFRQKEVLDPAALTILPEYQELYNRNHDLAGWLTIPDTEIDYPVVKAADNETYLKKNFDGESDANGTLFEDYRCDIANPSTNTIIYGHNMNSGQMFGSLSKYYEDPAFYEAHKEIDFSTIYEKKKYRVVAVCLSEVKYQDSSDYRYYNFINASNQAEWDAFVNNVKSLTIYPNDFDVAAGDELLTLSTCDHYKDNGRLFVVAKRVKESE